VENHKKTRKLTPHKLGRLGEAVAQKYLKEKNYQILETGFRLYRGEIDVIALDGKTLVFVEIKTRSKSLHGFPEESVTLQKQRQIRKIAQGFLTLRALENIECRFDVISLVFEQKSGFSLSHITNAF
jgi:putative endonuclease